MQNLSTNSGIEPDDEQQTSLQTYFKPHISPDDIEQVFRLKRAQPLLQAFTALFHGGSDGVLVRLLVLQELAADDAQVEPSDGTDADRCPLQRAQALS